jgi:hypothetical protein
MGRVARLRMKRFTAIFALAAVAAFGTTPAQAYDVRRVKASIRRAWGGNDRKAIRVARCESSLNPKATSPTGKYLGLWQFSRATWADYDGPGTDPRKVSAYKQTQVAYRLFQDRGWGPWPTCGSAKAGAADAKTGPRHTEARRSG